MDQMIEYIEAEFKKGFSISKIRHALITSGHDITHVEVAIKHMLKKRLHFQLLFYGALFVMILGLFVLESGQTDVPVIDQPSIEHPQVIEEGSVAYKRIAENVPVPRVASECDAYTVEIERSICLKKFETMTPVYYR